MSSCSVSDTFRKILGVRFYISGMEGLLDLVPGGGLIVVPSAPVLVHLEDDPAHREALECADFALTDSGFMVWLWLIRTGERVRRISGLRFMRGLFSGGAYRSKGDTFWIMPTEQDSAANLSWLKGQGFDVGADDAYVAPLYPKMGPIADDRLVALIQAKRPKLVLVGLSGCVQERLGWELRKKLGYTPAILCIGGAIAFLSGQQTGIPVWADRLAFGWMFRFVSRPRSFAAKVSNVRRLPGMIWKYGSSSVAALAR
jgi:N-acetylglucosaminyldiphosphoundecaprenol N-acetyl-beta-D-mannosaminyltransferase